jgi:phospholipid/cholesterol/gamma-HCH transport system permease protein
VAAESAVDGIGSPATLAVDGSEPGTLKIILTGDWLLGATLPPPDPLLEVFRQAAKPERVVFDATRLGEWNTGLVTTLVAIFKSAQANGIPVDAGGLPDGARSLLALAFAVKERTDAHRSADDRGFFEQVGEEVLETWQSTLDLVEFLGELVLSFGRMATGRATYLRQHIFVHIQEAGAEALPIVALISGLIGMIFAFVGVMQLNNFGAGIFTADLVAVAMVREIAAIMTAIIMAGRTGAAYAAEIGTMKVNEEIDALTTLGINPVDFLVTPRVIALILMMPLLTVFASLMGIIGGMGVGLLMLDVSIVQYVEQTIGSLRLGFLFGGLFKSVVYGSLVAVAGCLQGMACGNSAMAVGVATTKAVVMGIVLVVVSASVLTVIYINLGI